MTTCCAFYDRDSGVTDMTKIVPTLKAMAECGVLLLVHGEVSKPQPLTLNPKL
jgi:dihydroorotase